MAGMPAMDESEPKPKKKGEVDLALVFGGKPKGGAKAEPMGESDDGDELPAGFEDAFSEAFPEAAGDTERMMAMKRLISLCSY